MMPNNMAINRREELIKLGFDHILVRPNQKVSRHLCKRFF